MNAELRGFAVPLIPATEELSDEFVGCSRVDRSDLWGEDMSSLPETLRPSASDVEWYWAHFDWRDTLVLVPSADWFHRTLTSRNYPVVTPAEQSMLRQATAIIAGLSVGRSVATQLARFGVERFVLFDGDHLAPANMNRLHGASICDLGLSKVESVAREILEINPWASVNGAVGKLDGEGLRSILASTPNAVVVEMVDDTRAKGELRSAAREWQIPLLMGTDVDWEPMVDIELPQRPMFGGRISPEEFEELVHGDIPFERRTAIAMRMMALPRWAPRSLAGGQLAAMGEMKYWPQIGPCAAATAALTVRAFFDLVRDASGIPDRAHFSLSGSMGTADDIDHADVLMARLQRAEAEREAS